MGLLDNIFGKSKASKDITECEAQLEKRPEDPVLLKKLGDFYIKAHRNEDAAAIYLRLGDTYNEKGFFPKAIALYKHAQKIHPSWEMSYDKLATLYETQGFARDAASQYVKLSELMESIGESEKATTYMQKAAELDPSHKHVTQKVRSFNVPEAEKSMLEELPSTSKKPAQQDRDFFNLNAELDREIEELEIEETADETMQDESPEDITGVGAVFKALEENAAQEGSQDPLFLYNMGLAYRETGLLDEAEDAFLKVIATNEKLFDAHIMLGITYREKNLFDKSMESMKQAAALPDVTEDMKVGVLYEIGQTYKAMGKTEQALKIFRDIQKEHKDFKDVDLEIVKLAGGG